MDGLKLLRDAEHAGLDVSANGDKLVIRGPRQAESLARKLIEHKAHVLPLLTDSLPSDWHAVWDERAAIMEYEGGLHRELAEHLALLEIRKQMTTMQQLPQQEGEL